MASTPRSVGSIAYRALSIFSLILIAVAIAAPASAHPGHGVTSDGDSAAHYLLEPMHGLGVVAVLAITVASAAIIRARRNARRFTQQ